jgi:hypothetical protein
MPRHRPPLAVLVHQLAQALDGPRPEQLPKRHRRRNLSLAYRITQATTCRLRPFGGPPSSDTGVTPSTPLPSH